MLRVELGSSRRAWLLLVGYVTVGLVFGAIGWAQRDALSVGLSIVAWSGVGRMVLLLRRRADARVRATDVATGRASARTADDTWFVGLGRQIVGARSRPGAVVIGPSSAAFVVLGGWTHLVWRLLTAPLAVRFRFVDLTIDLPRDGDLDLAVAELVRRHGGFLLDGEWTYASSQRWWVRPGAEGIVWVERPPPASSTARWLPVPPPTPAQFQWIRNRILAVGAGITAVLGLGGLAAWRWTGNVDYLVAGLFYAVLIAGAVVGALVIAQRRFGSAGRAP